MNRNGSQAGEPDLIANYLFFLAIHMVLHGYPAWLSPKVVILIKL